MQRENRRLTLINSLIVTASRNLRVRLDALNRLRNRPPTLDAFSELRDLLKDSVEGIAMDIKFQPGERHRCGLWWEEDGELVLRFASIGFPRRYLDGGRRLNLDRSTAGRAFRRCEAFNVPDVSKDPACQGAVTLEIPL